MDVMAAACLGIGTVILCRRQKKKNVDSQKSGLTVDFDRGKQTVHFIVYLKISKETPNTTAIICV